MFTRTCRCKISHLGVGKTQLSSVLPETRTRIPLTLCALTMRPAFQERSRPRRGSSIFSNSWQTFNVQVLVIIVQLLELL